MLLGECEHECMPVYPCIQKIEKYTNLNDDVFAVEKTLKPLIKSLEKLDNVERNNTTELRRSSRNKNISKSASK